VIRLEGGMIDLMHILQKVVGVQAMLRHHPAHGGAIAAIIVFLDFESLRLRNFEIVGHEIADAHVHLLPEIDVVRIECVVEIEYPCLDMSEVTAWLVHHGIPNRKVLPAPLFISTGA
jgi:hypothetical protein